MHHRLLTAFCGLVALSISAASQPAGTPAATPPRIGCSEPKPRAGGTIRLATYNFENLCDTRDDPSLSGLEEDAKNAKPPEQLKALGETLRRIDADIVACEEIESYDALIDFRECCAKDLGYQYVQSIDVGAERGIEQAVLSRFPIVHAEVWPVLTLDGVEPATVDGKPNKEAGKPMHGRRSPLCVTVEVPAEKTGGKPYRLTMLVVHHKSGRAFDYWREAEARTFVAMVKKLEQGGANVVVLGDFNAGPDQKAVKTYIEAGMTDVLASHGSDKAFITHASGRQIDHVLVNQSLLHEVVPGSEFVLYTPQLRPEEDWRTAPKPAGYASDHLPVVVDIKPVDE